MFPFCYNDFFLADPNLQPHNSVLPISKGLTGAVNEKRATYTAQSGYTTISMASKH